MGDDSDRDILRPEPARTPQAGVLAFAARTGMGRLAGELAVYAASRAVPVATSMVFMLLCVQVLNSSEYATYSLSVLPAQVAGMFAGGLAGQPLLRFGIRLDANGRKTALWTIPLLAAAAAMPLLGAWTAWRGGSTWVALAALPLVPLLALVEARRAFLVSHSDPSGVFRLDALRTAPALVALLGVVFWRVQTEGVSALVPVAALCFGAASAVCFWRAPRTSVVPDGIVIVDRSYVQYGVWTAAWMAIAMLFPLLERTFIQSAEGLDSAGVYAAIADPLNAALSAGTIVIGQTLWPKYVSAWDSANRERVRRLTLAAVLGTAAMGAVVALLVLVLARTSAGRLGQLVASNLPLSLSMLAVSTLWGAAAFVHKPLELTRNTRRMFGCFLLSMALFAPLGRVLVASWSAYGIIAAKGAAAISYLVLVRLATLRAGWRVTNG